MAFHYAHRMSLRRSFEALVFGVTRAGDFDNLQDLGTLLQYIRNSDVFLMLLTESVMSRPWCILEIHAAVSAGIPIVGVTLRGNG